MRNSLHVPLFRSSWFLVLYSAFSASSLEIRARRAGSAAEEVLEVVLLAVEEELL